MTFKLWKFNLQQLIPTCFHPLHHDNINSHVSFNKPHDHPRHQNPNDPHRSHPRRRKKRRQIKVITSNGTVLIYKKPIRASKLMHEFPTHLLCRSDSFNIGQKIKPLNPKKKLKRGHNYFLLPKPYFQSTLTFASAAAAFAATAKLVNNCRAFSIEKTSDGGLRIRVSDEFIDKLSSERRRGRSSEEEKERVCNTVQLMKDYTQLVGLSRQWRPKLESIKEKEKQKFRAFRKKGFQKWKGLHKWKM